MLLGCDKSRVKNQEETDYMKDQISNDSISDSISIPDYKTIEYIQEKVNEIDFSENLTTEKYHYQNKNEEIFEIWIAKNSQGEIAYFALPLSDTPLIDALYYYDHKKLIFISISYVEKGFVPDESEYRYYMSLGKPFYFERYITQNNDFVYDTSYVLTSFTDELNFPLYNHSDEVEELIKNLDIID